MKNVTIFYFILDFILFCWYFLFWVVRKIWFYWCLVV